jgi:hypothetical protein
VSIRAYTDGNVLRAERSGRRTALGVLLGGLVCLGVGVPYAVQAQSVIFNNASLQGTYAYTNNVQNVQVVSSVGLISFNGNGGVALQIKVNYPDPTTGDLTVIPQNGTGKYTVEPTGIGVATIRSDTETEPTTYDFVITGIAKRSSGQALATEVSAMARSSGLSGGLVAPTWKRISD